MGLLTARLPRLALLSALALTGCPAAPERAAAPTPPSPSPEPAPSERRYVDDLSGRIVVTVLSLPAHLVESAEGSALVESLSRTRPERRLVVLSEAAFSPWPRDPFLFFWRGPHPVLVARPNRQPGREGDFGMTATAVQTWPPGIERPTIETSEAPFHAGNFLTDQTRVWVSIHSLETDVLRRLGLRRVPTESFATEAGIATYLVAARAAAVDLGHLLGRRPTWVHPLDPLPELFSDLAPGAGLDLDSYVTLLRGGRAFVGSLAESRTAVAASTPGDLESLRTFYGLRPAGRKLAEALLAANSSPRATALERYLTLVARHLAEQGIDVERIPLVRIPTDLFADREGVDYPEFFLSWNNVVLEVHGAAPRAEGFELRFPSVDRAMAARWARAGVPYAALPPLRRSIVLGGGYRCASNHLREP